MINEVEAIGYLTIVIVLILLGISIVWFILWFILATLETIEIVHKSKIYKEYIKELKRNDKEWWEDAWKTKK